MPQTVVPDNAKTAVSRACRYEPELNPTYHDWAVHYGVAVLPARVRKPRDKAKVEVGVQVVERWDTTAHADEVWSELNGEAPAPHGEPEGGDRGRA